MPVLHVQRGCELSTFTPGATTSGLTRKSTSVGPQLEKPAMMLLFGVWKYAFVAEMVVETPSLAFSRLPSLSETMYAGTVGSFGIPPRPIAVASPPLLFTTRTATAPASCAFRIFSENVQTPREMSAILSVRLPAAGLRALQAVLSRSACRRP